MKQKKKRSAQLEENKKCNEEGADFSFFFPIWQVCFLGGFFLNASDHQRERTVSNRKDESQINTE